ncbi:MAG: divergent polysaccharide deacetylase family protein [Saccharospirillaceae bacterium]|nr:divergent polysaccharide deacetylase family protein [Saccharospirillaceae bacterium]MCD8530590.1 divergent polysaccharide deacetylase family protein [Saccharospirillaceae bacterium]
MLQRFPWLAAVSLFTLFTVLPAHGDSAANSRATAGLLLIIDDIGNNQRAGKRVIALPGPLNLAFLPHTPYSALLAEEAFQAGHGVMLHAPMANEQGARLGPGALVSGMDQASLQQTLSDSLAAIPHVQGMNNHMGSLLTQQADAMNWVMQVARQQGLFFVDSLTSPKSVALEQARAAGIPALERDVFLDNDTHPAALKRQFEQALQLAKQRGYAVLIGHPYPETLAFLAQELPALHAQNVRLTRVDQFLQQRLWLPLQPATQTPSRYLLRATGAQLEP